MKIKEILKDSVIFDDGVQLYSNGNLKDEAEQRYIHSMYDVWETPKSYFSYVSRGDWLGNLEVPEDVRQKLMKKFVIGPEDTLIDVGVYAGWNTVRMSQQANIVFAIEADKDNCKMIEKNIQANGIKNIILINMAAGAERGEMTFYHGAHEQEKSLYPSSLRKVVRSEVMKVDKIDNVIKSATFVTLDINLGDLDALKGMENLLINNDMRIIAAGFYSQGKVKSCYLIKEYLDSLGYHVYIGKMGRVYALKKLD